MFSKTCKNCGKPIRSQKLSNICYWCKSEIKEDAADIISEYLDKASKENPCKDIESREPIIKQGDEIWFKRSHSDNIFHKFVDTVRDNVFRTVDSEDNVGEAGSTWSQDSWWEFDNVRILEIERKDNNE